MCVCVHTYVCVVSTCTCFVKICKGSPVNCHFFNMINTLLCIGILRLIGLDKGGYPVNFFFLFSPRKRMLWVLLLEVPL